jgi:hypothetical protein
VLAEGGQPAACLIGEVKKMAEPWLAFVLSL